MDNELPIAKVISPNLKLYIGYTFFKFTVTKNYKVANNITIAPFIKNNLIETEWNPRFNKWIITASYCTRDNEGYCRMPIGFLNKFKRYLLDNYCQFEEINIKDEFEPSSIRLDKKRNVELRENQVKLFEFLTDLNIRYKPVAATTGSGKGVLGVLVPTVLKFVTLICLNGLINQWYKNLLTFTNIKKEDIYVIQGFEPLRALWEIFNNGYRPKVIIASARTIYMYISEQEGPYTELPTFEEMQRSFGIGIAIHDEVHMNFCTNTKIDLYTNVRYNIYLSATYMRNNMQSRKIFNTVFPPSIVYGALNANIVKYTKVIFGKYILHLNEKERNKCIKQKGYSHAVYEGVVLKNSEAKYIFFQYILKPIVDMYYIQVAKPKQKCLVLCWTKDMCIHVYDYLKTVFRDKKVTLYFSGSKSKEGNEKNLDKDIIISTEKSCGTGRDIKGLKTCINTISIASEPLTRQIFGRLRQIPGEETIFIDMWNREMSSHYHHYRKRLIIYRDIATSVFETSFN